MSDNANVIENEVPEDIQQLDDNVIVLPSGEALSMSEIYPISATENSKFVVMIGATGSGKTTLISFLYQIFLSPSRIKGYYFAGSKTLSAFEERSFYSRTVSYEATPDTIRTPRGLSNNILHIRILKKETSEITNLLLADISGEDYESVIGNTYAAKESFPIVSYAKSVVVLLDGNKLIKPRDRIDTIQQTIHLLKTFADSKLIRDDADIFLVISKFDLIKSRNDKELLTRINEITDKISEQVPNICNKLKLIKTAAMPNDENVVDIGYGVEDLLSCLLNRNILLKECTPIINMDSQFDLWKIRRLI